MPNFWTTTTQSIYECFNGPRTKDVEFDQKVDEVKQIVNMVNRTKGIVLSFQNHIKGILVLCQELYNILPKVYEEKSIYYQFSQEICNSHRDMEKSFRNAAQVIAQMQTVTGIFEKKLGEVKENLFKREEARKVYDHYDEKMEELVKERNEKLARHVQENVEDIEKFDRVSKIYN